MGTPARVVIGIILAVGIFIAGYVANRPSGASMSSGAAKQAATYTCPMHPQYTSDHPGDCPICGMRLEPTTSSPGVLSGDGEAPRAPSAATGSRRMPQIGQSPAWSEVYWGCIGQL